MSILAILFIWEGGMIQAHKAKDVGPQKPRGSVLGTKGVITRDTRGRFYNRTGWDHGSGPVEL
jgi:hypothetical protein